MISITTVAKAAGVSAMTVSRVINNSPYVSEKTRQKVEEVIRTLDYHPNILARNLSRRGKSRTIALLLKYEHFLFVDYFMRILKGIEEAVEKHDHDLILWRYNPEERKSYVNMIRWYHSGLIKGVIVIAPTKGEHLLRTLVEQKVPFVIIGNRMDPSYNLVDVENERGAYVAVEHLINLGHKRIGFIAGWEDEPNANERKDGYIQALLDHRLPIQKELMVTGYFEEERGAKAMEKLLSLNPGTRPTAVFAANDLMAIGAMRAIQKTGLKVPDDIAVVGFDDIDIAARVSPALTTIHQPMQDLGEFAAKSLITNEGDFGPIRKIFGVQLVVRESSGVK